MELPNQIGGMELPEMFNTSYASGIVDLNQENANARMVGMIKQVSEAELRRRVDPLAGNQIVRQGANVICKEDTMRIVKIFIADPNQNIPLDKRVIYKGEEQLTDLTNQELFYEIEIGRLLREHNVYRESVRDKAASERAGKDVFLEPIRIRDLKMVVVDVAVFA